MTSIRLEVCVEDAAGLAAAITAGADRIELCSALALGGLTPSPGLIAIAARAPVPVRAMIRPRAGSFVFTPDEVSQMLADIEAVKMAGLAGVVLGANTADGRLDTAILANLRAAARPLAATLHRAFDLVPDPLEALDAAIQLGFDRILTSGLARTAPEGTDMLAALVERAAGRIGILPGSGISVETVEAILSRVDVNEVHASCSTALREQAQAVALGFTPAERRVTDGQTVRALKAKLAR